MSMTEDVLRGYMQYGGCAWTFKPTFEEAKVVSISDDPSSSVGNACWASVWSTGARGYKHIMNMVEYGEHFYMAVPIRTRDYLWYVQRYIDELIELFAPHFRVEYIPESVAVYYTGNDFSYKRIYTTYGWYSEKDKTRELEYSHDVGRCVIEILKDEHEPQQPYHAFLSYIRHVWEWIQRFPVQEEPPSLRDVWLNMINTAPNKTSWSSINHSNFAGSNSYSQQVGMTVTNYVDKKIEVISSKMWPTEQEKDTWNIIRPQNTSPNVKMELRDAAISALYSEQAEDIPAASGEYDPWED